MADEVKAPDSAKPPEGAQTGSPAATAAPAPDASQVELQRVRTELGIERKRREDAQRALHARTEELKRYQQEELKRYQQPEQELSQGTEGFGEVTPEVLAETIHSAAYSRVIFENASDPTTLSLIPKMDEVLADPLNVQRYRRATPLQTYREVLRDLKMQAMGSQLDAVTAERDEARKQLEARSNARESLASQAIVSGSAASQGPETLTREDIEKMSKTEMEEKFGKEAMLRNIVR